MEYAHVGERLRVGAVFGDSPGGVRPVWFEWRQRRVDVERISYRWQGRQGSEKVLYFAVQSGTTSYELCYHTANQFWRLACTCSE